MKYSFLLKSTLISVFPQTIHTVSFVLSGNFNRVIILLGVVVLTSLPAMLRVAFDETTFTLLRSEIMPVKFTCVYTTPLQFCNLFASTHINQKYF